MDDAAASSRTVDETVGPHAWAEDPIFACSGEMAQRMRAHDWTTTPLGPPRAWPSALRAAVSILLRSKYAMILTWGPDFVMLYNDAFIPTLGAKHPDALGGLLHEQFAEVWDDVGPMQRAVLAGGEATWFENLPLVIERGSGPEETYFTFSYSPVPDGQESGGVLAVLSVTTAEVLGAARLAVLNDVNAPSALGPDLGASARLLVESLQRHSSELPAARLWLPVHREAHAVVAEYGDVTVLPAPPEDPATDVPAQDSPGPGARPAWVRLPLPVAEDQRGCLDVALNPLRLFDEDHRSFLHVLGQQVAQQLGLAVARAQEHARAEALAELDAAKTRFLSTVSHELRTPLTLLLGPMEDLLSGRTGALDADDVHDMHQNAHRLLRLVNGLLDVAKAESHRLESAPEPVEVGPFTREIVEPLLRGARGAGLTTTLHLDVEGAFLLDPHLWETVAVNLVGNAVKYTLDGHVTVHVQHDEELTLTVADTGIGIPEDQHQHVFRRFHRVVGSEGRSIEGVGVGLAIVADAVEAMSGTVEMRSTPGEGTTFVVRVPALRAAGGTSMPPPRTTTMVESFAAELLGDADIEGEMEPASTTAGEVGDEGGDEGEREPVILVADDNPGMRRRVARLLAEVGRPVTAADGRAALELLRSHRVDLVVTDVMMPHLDGEGLLREVRADERLRSTPVILLTARAGPEAAVTGLSSGADDYIAKPFLAEELVARVRSTLALVQARREDERRRARDTILAGVSHDMQTPMATLVAGLRLLSSKDLPPDLAELTTILLRKAGHLSRLVSQFLDWSAMSLDQPLAQQLEPVRLASLVEKVHGESPLPLEVEPIGEVTVLVDELRLLRILLNLVENSANAGATRVCLQVESGNGPDRGVRLRVADDGPGVPPDMRPSLFQPWASTSETRGTGLGLYVSREAARAMGGDLEYAGDDSGRSVFVLTLPRPLEAEHRARPAG